jgi:hypothetical protein
MLLPPQRALVGVVAGVADGGSTLAYSPGRQLLVCGTLGGSVGASSGLASRLSG